MRIGLDARSLFMPRPRGTGRNLCDAYQVLPRLAPQWDFFLYHQRHAAREQKHVAELAENPNVSLRRIDMPGDRFDLWFQVRLPLAAWRDRLDLLHAPANAAPLLCPVPLVVTVHDLIPLTLDGEATSAQRRRFEAGIRRAVGRAEHIITPSAATRAALCERFAAPLERVTVIPWAADAGVRRVLDESDAAQRESQVDLLRRRYGLRAGWLLNFSGASLRKNAERLLSAFARIPSEQRRRAPLVLVGCEPAEFRNRLTTLAEQLGIGADCHALGFVPHAELPWFLEGARAVLLPSLREGFGLPLLDAFAADRPVLSSRDDALAEVAGPAAEYCDATDVESIAAAITGVLDERRATELVRLGRVRRESYSWRATASALRQVYARCAAREARTRRRARALEAT